MIVDLELTFREVRLIQMNSRILEETIIVKKKHIISGYLMRRKNMQYLSDEFINKQKYNECAI